MRKNLLPFWKAPAVVELGATVLVTFFLLRLSLFAAPARAGHAGGVAFRWRQLLHDLPERG